MITFDLRGLIDDYESRTGLRISYQQLAEQCGVSADTIKSLATRPGYNATLQLISKIGANLSCDPIRFLSWTTEPIEDGDRPDT